MTELNLESFQWHYEEWGAVESPTLLMLHGFTGSSQSWKSFAKLIDSGFRIVAVDLPGHGKTPIPKASLSLFELADELAKFVRKIELQLAHVLGYSMGGRVALHLALAYPELLSSLILIGASPGIADARERQKRYEMDRALAESIRKNGIEWFVEFWEKQPIFKSQESLPETDRENLRQQRLQNSPEGLAYALENWSSGCQENLLPRVHELELPVLLLAGEKDQKYRELNEAINNRNQNRITNQLVNSAGHAVQVEQPQAAANIVNEFLRKIQE